MSTFSPLHTPKVVFTILLVLSFGTIAASQEKVAAAPRKLYLLAGTPIDNDPASYPATLYTVAPGKSLETVRIIFTKSQGLLNVWDDFEGSLYVLSESQMLLTVIHERDPELDDTLRINLDEVGDIGGAFEPDIGVIDPPGKGSMLVLPEWCNGSCWKLVTVAGDRGVVPRVSKGDWSLYRWFRYRGTPLAPWEEMISRPRANIADGQLIVPVQGVPHGDSIVKGKLVHGPILPGTVGIIGDIPPNLPPSVGAHTQTVEDAWGKVSFTIRGADIVADTPRFLAFDASRPESQWPVPIYVLDRITRHWSIVESPFLGHAPKVFGAWLATTDEEPSPSGRKSPGAENERQVPGYEWKTSEFPDIRNEIGYWATSQGSVSTYMPGKLLLQNLVDNRTITIDTGQQDSEVLDVRDDGLALYRVNDEIFSAQITNNKVSAPTLVVKGEDVPEVHWVFWSNFASGTIAHWQANGRGAREGR